MFDFPDKDNFKSVVSFYIYDTEGSTINEMIENTEYHLLPLLTSPLLTEEMVHDHFNEDKSLDNYRWFISYNRSFIYKWSFWEEYLDENIGDYIHMRNVFLHMAYFKLNYKKLVADIPADIIEEMIKDEDFGQDLSEKNKRYLVKQISS